VKQNQILSPPLLSSLNFRAQNGTMVSPSSLPTTFPINSGDELAEFWPPSPAMAPRNQFVIEIPT
jgi:hypothetical protein